MRPGITLPLRYQEQRNCLVQRQVLSGLSTVPVGWANSWWSIQQPGLATFSQHNAFRFARRSRRDIEQFGDHYVYWIWETKLQLWPQYQKSGLQFWILEEYWYILFLRVRNEKLQKYSPHKFFVFVCPHVITAQLMFMKLDIGKFD
jgi:hypothetical protein